MKINIIYLIISIGVISSCSKFKEKKVIHEDSLSISYYNALDLDVHRISFERNGLLLNGHEYNASGISGYSRLHFIDTIYSLKDIAPPFTLKKKKNNDSLELIKDNQQYLLNITEEINWAGRKYD